jgi:hypothetical protein
MQIAVRPASVSPACNQAANEHASNPDPLHRQSASSEEGDQRFRLARRACLAHNLSGIIDNADCGLLQRYVQPGEITHGFPLNVVADAYGPRTIMPRGAAIKWLAEDPNHPILTEKGLSDFSGL